MGKTRIKTKTTLKSKPIKVDTSADGGLLTEKIVITQTKK